jgi:hypothetical protein
MLNWDQIAQRIQNPTLSKGTDLVELKELCVKYPYSQVFPLVYLKAISDEKHIHFEEELENFAYRITDRVQLYDLLNNHSEKSTDEILLEDSKQEETNQPAEIALDLPEDIESKSDDESPIEEIPVALVENSSLKTENEADLAETDIQSPSIDFILNPEKVDSDPEMDALEKQIMASSLSANFQLEDVEEEDTLASEIAFDLSIVNQTMDDEEEIEIKEIGSRQSSSINFEQPRTFTNWLKINETSSEGSIDDMNDSEPELIYIEFDKPKREFFSPAKIAKESLSEETLPVSETLAKIFEIQGNIPKAIYVYEQLGLIIPEKKSYFASQIRKLKKKLN